VSDSIVRTYNYKNVTISGLPGSGSTTLLRRLKEELQFDGWKGFSGGEFMRAYAAEKGLFDANKSVHHSAAAYEEDFDRQVDMGMRQKLSDEEKWILESWLSGFMAQQVPGTLKILMMCSDRAINIDRIVNRDGITADEAKAHIDERYRINLERWSRMYADQWQEWVVKPGTVAAGEPIDFWRPDLYDLVIDTYSQNQDQALELALDAIQKTT
jgi:cytidylate kinase